MTTYRLTKLAVVGSMLAALAACGSSPMQTSVNPANGTVSELVTVIDGCKLWRVSDGLRNVYVAICPDHTTTSTRVNCGYNCWRDEDVYAVRVQP